MKVSVSIILFVLCASFLSIQFVKSQTFTEQTGISLMGIDDGESKWGDYDNDGDLDILISGSYGPNPCSKIYKNNGDNTFTEQIGILSRQFQSSTADWVDFDNDGDLDVFLTGQADAWRCMLYRNNGNNTFTELAIYNISGINMGTVDWADYNNDGYKDIIVAGGLNSRIYKNNGNSTFTYQTTISITGVRYGSVEWGDYDNDGNIDLLISGTDGTKNITKVYRNNGDNTFTEQTSFNLTGVELGVAVWGDYDNNGFLDILLTGFNGTSNVTKIYKNNGNNSFTEQTDIVLPALNNGRASWGDFDNDGDLDLVLAGHAGGTTYLTKVFRNDGNNSFVDIQSLSNVIQGCLSWGDYDNDGDLDILYNGTGIGLTNVTKVFLNNTNAINNKALAPGNLRAEIQNVTNINLTWNKTTDAETPQNSLTYNFYIYESGKTTYKATPQSFKQTDMLNGRRHIAHFGNVSYNSGGVLIKGLPYGNYKWSVQAIDGGLKGGSFAVEDSFSLVDLTKTSIHAGNGLITTTTTAMEYSLNSTDGTNGTWASCINGNTTVNFGTGGFDIWIRQIDQPNNKRKLATIAAQLPAPTYTVNFTTEKTSQNVVSTDEYSTSAAMLSATSGTGVPVTVSPGINLYFRVKGTASVLASAIQTLEVPNRPGTPAYSIDYTNITTDQIVLSSDEYSVNSNLSASLSGTGIKISVTPGQNLYFRTKSTSTGFASLIQTLIVPARPTTPAYTIDYVNEITVQNIPSTVEYSFNSDVSVSLSGFGFKINVSAGQNLYFRVKSTSTGFASLIQTLSVPARPATPAYTVDYVNETTVQNISSAVAYSWNPDMTAPQSGTGVKIPVTAGQNLYFRTKATSSAFASLIQTLAVPARPATPSYTIDYLNEYTVQSVPSTDEYSTNVNMSMSQSGTGIKVKITPGQNLYFRTKSTSSGFASMAQVLTVPARPAAPSNSIVNDVNNTFDWTYNPAYLEFSQYEYSLNSGSTWSVCTSKPLNIGNIELQAGFLQIRVKSASLVFKGIALSSNNAFTMSTGLSDIETEKIKIYPNPVRDFLTIESELSSLKASIFSLEGKLFKSLQLNSRMNKIDLSDLPDGMYLLRLSNADTYTVTRIVKE